eukprot:TRINITY_DN3034_c0_g1_i4.p1 TRINITY_DN3034_c0_g1~~TRINITY_DN3034_c0_g1_i4.p1  ORF type:complete len:360 (+),score=32.98 TRINITY_DN3034_c0_g1_i4:84-1163(+)
MSNMFVLNYKFKGQRYELSIDKEDPTLKELLSQIAEERGLSFETIKLVAPKFVRPIFPSSQLCSQAGLHSGVRVIILGSSQEQLEAIRNSREDRTIVGFQEELKRAARRIDYSTETSPSTLLGSSRFHSYKVLQEPGLSPNPQEALKLLQRLATDRSIVHIMTTYHWDVGLLSEMPPEGKVGVSAMCILGYNVNKGQEISLRLRTDDLLGFRKYGKIRETLIHELTHMVWSDHDINFKQLNSQLLREVEAFEAQNWGKQLDIANDYSQNINHLQHFSLSGEQTLMKNTAQSSGQTLAALAGIVEQHVQQGLNPTQAAGRAALLRNRQIYDDKQFERLDPTTQELEKQLERLGSVSSDLD